jgi:hypothetical protein
VAPLVNLKRLIQLIYRCPSFVETLESATTDSVNTGIPVTDGRGGHRENVRVYHRLYLDRYRFSLPLGKVTHCSGGNQPGDFTERKNTVTLGLKF